MILSDVSFVWKYRKNRDNVFAVMESLSSIRNFDLMIVRKVKTIIVYIHGPINIYSAIGVYIQNYR